MDYPKESTVYVRLSLMAPREGMLDELLELHRKLVEWLVGQPGFLRGYVIAGGDPEGRVGHITIYDSYENADQMAQTQTVLSMRSELMQLSEEGSQIEMSWTAYDPQLAKRS